MRGEQNDWPKLMLRLPPEVKDWIAAEADRNASSQNSEIVRCIRERIDKMRAMVEGAKLLCPDGA